jgi:hypothetical protein
MAGTLVANTINTDTGIFQTNNALNAIAKSYVFFTYSGGIITTYQSFNVSSVTRVSTGVYDINFTTAMSSNAYPVVANMNAGGSSTLGTAPTYGDRQASGSPTSTTQCRYIGGTTGSATVYDGFWNCLIVCGT